MIPFVAIGPGPDYPAVADVELAVEYDFGNLTGTLVVGGGPGDATLAKQEEILSSIAAVKVVTDKLATAIVLDGAVYQWTANALELAPSGGGSSPDLMLSTTIATVTSQTVFTLTAGAPDNDAYTTNCLAIITDQATSTQVARAVVADYVASTKTLTLVGAPTFTVAAGDSIAIVAVGSASAGAGDALQTTLLAVQATADAIAASLAGTPVESTGRVASGGGVTLYIGDDCTVASGTELEITVADPAGGLFTILDAIPLADLDFGASLGRKSPSIISGTIASLAQSGTGADTLLIISVEITAAGTDSECIASEDYEYHISARTNTTDDFVWVSGTLDLKTRRVAIPA